MLRLGLVGFGGRVMSLKVEDVMVKDKGGKLVGLVFMTDVARFEPHMMDVIKKLAAQQAVPRRMRKVMCYYIS